MSHAHELVIAPDPGVFLAGPREGDGGDRWLQEAHAAVVSDWGLGDDVRATEYADYLLQLLAAFSRWETSGQLRLLRLRFPGDHPVPVSLEVHHEAPDGPTWTAEEFADAALAVPDDLTPAGEVSLEDVVGAPGWRRLVYYVEDRASAVPLGSRVRYHCRFDQARVDVVLRAGGQDPGVTIGVLPELDDLVRTIGFKEPA